MPAFSPNASAGRIANRDRIGSGSNKMVYPWFGVHREMRFITCPKGGGTLSHYAGFPQTLGCCQPGTGHAAHTQQNTGDSDGNRAEVRRFHKPDKQVLSSLES